MLLYFTLDPYIQARLQEDRLKESKVEGDVDKEKKKNHSDFSNFLWSAGLKSSSPPQQFTSSRFANSNRLTATTGLHIPISPSCSLNHSCPAWTQGKEDLRNPLSLCLLAGRSAATLSSLKGNGGTFAISAR